MRSLRPFVVLVVVSSCNRAAPAVPAGGHQDPSHLAQESAQWLLGPDPTSDLLRADGSEAGLRAQFGTAAVRPDSVHVGEGLSEYGTRLFPGDSARELAIVWTDTVSRARPAYVYVTSPSSTWRLYPGVGIGTDLRTIEALNRGVFQLAGFDWDYSGTTGGFNGGRLDTLWRGPGGPGAAALLRLSPERGGVADSLAAGVQGDRLFRSDHPAMRHLNPRVYQILVRPR